MFQKQRRIWQNFLFFLTQASILQKIAAMLDIYAVLSYTTKFGMVGLSSMKLHRK